MFSITLIKKNHFSAYGINESHNNKFSTIFEILFFSFLFLNNIADTVTPVQVNEVLQTINRLYIKNNKYI